MNKFATRALLRGMELKSRAREGCKRIAAILESNDGNVIAENAMWIAFAFVIIVIIIAWAQTYTKGTFLPDLGNKLTNLFNPAS